MEFTTDNIINCYRRANSIERAEGFLWYECVSLTAKEIGREFGVDKEKVALVISAMSPRRGWNDNKRKAFEVIKNHCKFRLAYASGCMKAGLDKCQKILDTPNGASSHILFRNAIRPDNASSVLGKHSYKTKAFAAIIFNHTNPNDYVCIDTHAINIAYGAVQTSNVVNRFFSNAELYSHMSGAYNMAAYELQLKVHELQAVTWTHWRNEIKGVSL